MYSHKNGNAQSQVLRGKDEEACRRLFCIELKAV